MAYVALYRKWRPKIFEDVVGQRHITETLQKAIETDKVAHSYLFSGPRGTGKTSTAKIFARAMNCRRGPTAHPCNECDVCRHIAAGESLDVVEIDAASNRSVDDIRTLRETVKFMPAEGQKKVYIIDEVHMLTTEAFNALLKTLEEPPGHVIFILATTEPERIPVTILSRCQRYEFRRITSGDIAERLLYIAAQEQIDITAAAARIIALQADGGMRDALSLLDQCAGNSASTIDEDVVRSLLGLVGREWLFRIGEALRRGDGRTLIEAVDTVVAMGKEPRTVLTEVIAHLRAVMLCQAAPQSDLLAAYADASDRLAAAAAALDGDRVFAMIEVLQDALLRAKTSPLPRIAVEMGLLMASRVRGTEQGDLGGRVKRLEERNDTVPPSVLERIGRIEAALADGRPLSHSDPASAASVRSRPADVAAATTVAAKEMPEEEPAETRAAASASPLPQPAAVSSERYDAIWQDVCRILDKERKKVILACVRGGRIVHIGDTDVIVSLKGDFMVKRANGKDYYTHIDAALAKLLGKGYHMVCYEEKDPALAAYEKKNAENPVVGVTRASVPQTPLGRQRIGVADIPEAERKMLDPLLKTVGECTIYLEDENV